MSETKRNSVNYDYTVFYWPFIRAIGEIGHYGAVKYGRHNYRISRLTGEKSPINHAIQHLADYQEGKPHDRFNTRKHQLAAAAFNAMMEFFWCDVDDEVAHKEEEMKRESADLERAYVGHGEPAAPAQQTPPCQLSQDWCDRSLTGAYKRCKCGKIFYLPLTADWQHCKLCHVKSEQIHAKAPTEPAQQTSTFGNLLQARNEFLSQLHDELNKKRKGEEIG